MLVELPKSAIETSEFDPNLKVVLLLCLNDPLTLPAPPVSARMADSRAARRRRARNEAMAIKAYAARVRGLAAKKVPDWMSGGFNVYKSDRPWRIG
jgi:hypothetical protein